MGTLKFDKTARCKKCGNPVHRLARFKTWHHISNDDYFNCGYVIVDETNSSFSSQEMKKK